MIEILSLAGNLSEEDIEGARVQTLKPQLKGEILKSLLTSKDFRIIGLYVYPKRGGLECVTGGRTESLKGQTPQGRSVVRKGNGHVEDNLPHPRLTSRRHCR